jgi:CHAD domain-containing protein
LFDLGLELVEAFPARLGLRSKAERAHALAAFDRPAPVHADSPALRPDMTIEETIAAVLRNCLAHFLGNLPTLESGDKIAAVHQMRVAMRRLRSALKLFVHVAPCSEFEALAEESKRIATVLGGARDWDVFVERLTTGPLGRFSASPGFGALLAAAEGKADEGHAEVDRLAADKAVARFVLRVERMAASRGWRDGADESALTALEAPIEEFARGRLDALRAKLKHSGRHFRSMAPEKRHALRIAMKHMRYATEFFGALFPDPSAAEHYAEKAAALQEQLGALNDAVIEMRLIDTLGSANATYAAGLVAGWCARDSEGDPAALKAAWRKFLHTTPFWRREAD